MQRYRESELVSKAQFLKEKVYLQCVPNQFSLNWEFWGKIFNHWKKIACKKTTGIELVIIGTDIDMVCFVERKKHFLETLESHNQNSS